MQAIIDCSDYIKMVQKAQKCKALIRMVEKNK